MACTERENMVLYESLKAIFLHIDNHEKALFNEFSLTLPRFYVLMHLSQHPAINYIELSDRMLCTKSNTTRIVQSMLEDGLVKRESHPDDRRSYQLFITPAGQSVLDRVLPQYNQLIVSLMSSFNEEEVREYTSVSKHIESTLAPKVNGARSQLSATTRYGRLR